MLNNTLKKYAYVGIITILVLLLPFLGTVFISQMDWSLSDFIVMGLLIFTSGSLFVFLSSIFSRYKIIIGISILILFLYIYAELAVGIFTNLGS